MVKKYYKNYIFWVLLATIMFGLIPIMVPYVFNSTNIKFCFGLINSLKNDYSLPFSTITLYKVNIIIIQVIACIVSYCSFKNIFNRNWISIIGTICYMYSPYRINSLYIKGDLGESFGIAILPLLVSVFYKIIDPYINNGIKDITGNNINTNVESEENKKITNKFKVLLFHNKEYLYLTTSYSLMFNFSLSIFLCSLFFTFIILIVFIKEFVKAKFNIIKLTIFFLVINFSTIIRYIDHLKSSEIRNLILLTRNIQNRGIYLFQNFLPFLKRGVYSDTDKFGFFNAQANGIGFVLIICILLYLWILFINKELLNRNIKKVAGVGILFLILSTNMFPWNYLQSINKFCGIIVSLIQYPTKMLPYAVILTVILCCYLTVWIEKKNKNLASYFFVAILTIQIITSQYLLNDILITAPVFIWENDETDNYEMHNYEIYNYDFILTELQNNTLELSIIDIMSYTK